MKKIFLPPLLFFLARAVQAATVTVDSTDDSLTATTGTCTLRGAVAAINDQTAANGCAAGNDNNDTIEFDSTVFASAQTIPVAGEHIEITKTLIIKGPVDASGNPLLTLDANPGDGPSSNRILYVTGGTSLSITGVRFVNGNVGSSNGGAILVSTNSHTLTLEQCVFGDNQANYGGAVFAWGIASISNSSFSGNRINIDNGSGGAVWAGTAAIRNSTFSGNQAARGSSGAVYAATAIVSDSTFSSNQANYGGAVNATTATIGNSTFSSNEANYGGGAVYADSSLNARHLTLLGNTAGNPSGGQALYVKNGVGALYNSIIIGKNDNDQCGKENGDPFTGSHNLEGRVDADGNWQDEATTCGTSIARLPDTGDALSSIIDSTLKDNGGPTQTLALSPNSPAIGAADTSALSSGGTSQMLDSSGDWTDATEDQRGLLRHAATYGRDIGAYENPDLPRMVVSPPLLPDGSAGTAYDSNNVFFTGAADSEQGYTFILADQPAGLSLSTTNQLTGTPIDHGDFTISVTITDTSTNLSFTRHLSLTILRATQPPSGTIGGTPIPTLPAPLLLMLAAFMVAVAAVRQRGR